MEGGIDDERTNLHKDTFVVHEGYDDTNIMEVLQYHYIKHRHFHLKQRTRGKSVFRGRRREYLF